MHKNKLSFLIVLLVLCTNLIPEQTLKVSENGRYIVFENGKPFFDLGDTAWELFNRLNREEAELYLTNRAEKGFTVIQAVAILEVIK